MNQSKRGAILVMLLVLLSLMLMLVVTLHQSILNQQRSLANSGDYELAEEYAKSAMLNAEATVYAYDLNAQLEQPPCSMANISADRYCVINQAGGHYNIVANGALCNQGRALKGWCFKGLGLTASYLPDPAYLPWLLTSNQAQAPCRSYSHGSGGIPLIDDATSRFSIEFQSGDKSLCAAPRYMLEILNLNFSGRFAANSSAAYSEEGSLTQLNGARLISYRHGSPALPSARLYRITVRAFGRNGNTRVSYQEYMALENYQPAGRTAGDSPGNAAYRIIPLSLRWLH